MISLERLKLRAGMRLRVKAFVGLWNTLVAAVSERTVQRGRNVRLRHSPDGVLVTARARGGGSGSVTHPWQMNVDEVDGKWLARFRRGMINGIEATIDGRYMSIEDSNGETPALTVGKEHFDARGIARVYAEVTFQEDAWYALDVKLMAGKEPPESMKFGCHKLIGLLVRDSEGTVTPENRAFFDLRITPCSTTPDGAAVYIPGVEA